MNRVIGFMMGVGAGAALGLLLAPRSGEKTRSLIKGKASDGAAYLREKGNDVRDVAAEAIRDGGRVVSKGTDAVKAAVEAGRQAYSQAVRS